MNRFEGVADTLFVPLVARIAISREFPEYFADKKAQGWKPLMTDCTKACPASIGLNVICRRSSKPDDRCLESGSARPRSPTGFAETIIQFHETKTAPGHRICTGSRELVFCMQTSCRWSARS